jgi:hypothetical protein
MERCCCVGPTYASYAGLVGPQTLYVIDEIGVSWEQNPTLVLHTLYTIIAINARCNSTSFQDNLTVKANHSLPKEKTLHHTWLLRSNNTSLHRWQLRRHASVRQSRDARTNSAEAKGG